ncbi:MAG: formate dehydrogenase accessory sulfurtransferase FdhD [Bacteroidetes bacterium]|nr:formate dehydrogenase accessory sulfurtransferase FdhD [Bacteroidota bacterium]
MAVRHYNGKKYLANSEELTSDALTVEEALQIQINGVPFTVTMRTPGEDECLVRGLLHSEDIITNKPNLPTVVFNKEDSETVITTVNVAIPEKQLGKGYLNSRSLLSVSSCGICGKTDLDTLDKSKKIEEEMLIESILLQGLFEKMNTFQFDFNESGGTHAAAAFSIDGTLLAAMEDIGRHNAVDKVVGKLIMTRRLKEAKIVTVSGRISYEIIIKCFRAQIPILAAVSAPSSLAVDYAKELGITLFAFCRDDRATCYSHAHRIKNHKIHQY